MPVVASNRKISVFDHSAGHLTLIDRAIYGLAKVFEFEALADKPPSAACHCIRESREKVQTTLAILTPAQWVELEGTAA